MKNYLPIILLGLLSTSSHADRFNEKLELAKQEDPSAQWFVGISYQYGRLTRNGKKINAHARFVLERNPKIMNKNQPKKTLIATFLKQWKRLNAHA